MLELKQTNSISTTTIEDPIPVNSLSGSRTLDKAICQKIDVQISRRIATVLSRKDFNGHHRITIGGFKVIALIDSGSSVSVIHDSLLSKIQKVGT